VSSIKLYSAIPYQEILDLIREVLEELKISYKLEEDGFYSDAGRVSVKAVSTKFFGIVIYEIEMPDVVGKLVREKIRYKRAGG